MQFQSSLEESVENLHTSRCVVLDTSQISIWIVSLAKERTTHLHVRLEKAQ